MQALFARIRWRLVGWNMLILGLILALLGTTVYVALARSLLDEVDRNLFSRSQTAFPILFGSRDPRRGPGQAPPGAPGEAPPPGFAGAGAGAAGQVPDAGLGGAPGSGPRPRTVTEGYSGGVFYLALLPNGSVLANPQQVATADLPWPDAGNTGYATIHLGDGDVARVVLSRTPDGGLLVVGQSLEPEESALHTLVLVLVAGGVLGLLLSLAAAWFLSNRALIPIQQAFQRQQEFVADASHELRTPLTVLHSATDLLNLHREDPLEKNGELFDDVRAEIGRMERLTQDLLTLARSDSGGLELMTAPLQMDGIAAEVVRRITPLALEQGIELGLHTETQPVTVEADPDRLQQVLLILIDNAVKHTPAGGRVDVRVRRAGQSGVVEVADTGSGIAPEDLPRVFDRFYRADKARVRERGGTGLGLAIARMLVEAHQGHLQISSTLRVGTQVSVALPLVYPPARLGVRVSERLPHSASRQ